MDTSGVSGTRRSLAVFAHRHPPALRTGCLAHCSGGDTAAGPPSPPGDHPGDAALSVEILPGGRLGVTPGPGRCAREGTAPVHAAGRDGAVPH